MLLFIEKVTRSRGDTSITSQVQNLNNKIIVKKSDQNE